MLETLENLPISLHGLRVVKCNLHLCEKVCHALNSYCHRPVEEIRVFGFFHGVLVAVYNVVQIAYNEASYLM